MATRRDQLQSYQFLTQRVISAFVMRETDPAQSPLRRGIGAIFGGLMIAVVVAAGFGVYGILTKVGGDAWKTDGSVVIEKETGASFVYFDGQVHPTLNYASALLAAGKPGPAVFRVATKALASVPRGVPVGIPGAPDSLPPASRRVGLPWTTCSAPGTDSVGKAINTVTIVVGGASTGGRALGERAILVRDTSSAFTYLVWHGHRYLVQQTRTLIPALFGSVVTAVNAGTAWLNTLPAGVDIGPITVTDRGKPSSNVPGRTIGDVLVAGPAHYLVFDDGLAPITPLQEALLAAQAPVQPITVAGTETASAKKSNRLNQPTGDAQPPQAVPTLATPGASDLLCAVTTDVKASPEVWVGGTVAALDTAARTGSATVDGVRLADRVLVPAGRVAIVRVLSSPTAETGAYYLVTDLGIRYAVPTDNALRMLGYQPDQAVGVPSVLVTRIPAGPPLDPAAAIKVATSGSGK